MGDQLPAIYWYVFWAVVALGAIAYHFFDVAMKHRRNMKALDILKSYADKGGEPPAAIAEQLTKQILDSKDLANASEKQVSAQQRRDDLLRLFMGFIFAACLAHGLNAWLDESGGARWAVHASLAARGFFGFGAFGLLLAFLLTRKD